MDRSRDVLRIATFQPLHGTKREEGADRAQPPDHRGNFFRLPHTGMPEKGDADPSLSPGAAGKDDTGTVRPASSVCQGRMHAIGIPLLKDILAEPHGPADAGFRILTDPHAAPDPILRLRQDRRIHILSTLDKDPSSDTPGR